MLFVQSSLVPVVAEDQEERPVPVWLARVAQVAVVVENVQLF